jgi:hypothetical protein
MNDMAPTARVLYPTLLTYAALSWLINGLHSRPRDDSAGKALVRCVLPLTSDTNNENLYTQDQPLALFDDEASGIPHTPGGLIFLRHITIPPEANTVRFLDGNRYLSQNVFKNLFGKSEEEIQNKISPTGFKTRSSVPRMRHASRKGSTHKRNRDELQQDPDNATFPHLNTIEVEHEIPDYGPDQEDTALPIYIQPVEPMGLTLDRLFAQFSSDIIQKIGNPKNLAEPSYCPLSRGAREHITPEDIMTNNLGELFTIVQWKKATTDVWQNIFHCLFPRREHVTPLSAQHYSGMVYYVEWKRVLLKLSCEDAGEVRTAMFQRFDTLVWAPAATTDRVWVYKTEDPEWNSLPRRERLGVATRAGPRIYLAPHNNGLPILRTAADIARESLREEEEESSDEE